jgi:DNA-binding NtrC family response regulator
MQHLKTSHTPIVSPLSSRAAFCCPAQVLVVDRPNGPAHVLVDTISLLLDREVSVMLVEEHADALRALDFYSFELVVVGLENGHSLQLAVLPHMHAQDPDLPVLVVGHDLPRLYRQYARTYGAREVLNLPRRAADLKALTARLARRYLA